jgi:putative acetyltransferase
MSLDIRPETPADRTAIRDLNADAFGRPDEGQLVDRLRANDGVLLSLVATLGDRIVGHILFSPVRVGQPAVEGAALGPMAVLPDLQRHGVGSKLVADGLARLAEQRCAFVVVLGHPRFYPRFGFVRASGYGVSCTWEVPDDAFLLLPLDPARCQGLSGVAEYREEFADVM